MRVAIIDLGSNSARMNIVEISGNKPEILVNLRRVVRLSEGMGDEKLLRPEAVERTLAVLNEFKRVIDENNVDKVRAVATAAMRTAKNPELLTEPLKEIGIEFEIITGEKESYYDYMAVINTLDVKNGLIIDIGGASTELILLKDGINKEMVSIPMAAVNITEKYFKNDIADDEETECAISAFTSHLEGLDWLETAKGFDIIGLGGTIRGLATMKCGQAKGLHGFVMSSETVRQLTESLAKMPLEQRAKIDGIGNGRADIILGGMVPLVAVMRRIRSKNLIACVSGLREGVMYDIVGK